MYVWPWGSTLHSVSLKGDGPSGLKTPLGLTLVGLPLPPLLPPGLPLPPLPPWVGKWVPLWAEGWDLPVGPPCVAVDAEFCRCARPLRQPRRAGSRRASPPSAPAR
jgi:hypothetical protein